jgi:hypothetical protein
LDIFLLTILITPELAWAVIESLQVRGVFNTSDPVKNPRWRIGLHYHELLVFIKPTCSIFRCA